MDTLQKVLLEVTTGTSNCVSPMALGCRSLVEESPMNSSTKVYPVLEVGARCSFCVPSMCGTMEKKLLTSLVVSGGVKDCFA